MDPNLFVDNTASTFLCSFCSLIVKDPVEHIDCEDVFCKSCLADLPHQVCPSCRGRLQNKTKPMNKMVREMIYYKLQRRCGNEGCQEVFPWPQQAQHEGVCEFGETPCTVPACKFVCRKKEMDEHCKECYKEHSVLFETKIRELELKVAELENKLHSQQPSQGLPTHDDYPLETDSGYIDPITTERLGANTSLISAVPSKAADVEVMSRSVSVGNSRGESSSSVVSGSTSIVTQSVQQLTSQPLLFKLTSANEDLSKFSSIWNRMRTGQLLPERGAAVIIFNILITGHNLICGCNDGYINIWDLTTHICVRQVKAHDGDVRFMMASPDNSKLYTNGNNDKNIKIWDTSTFTNIGSVKLDISAISCFTLANNGNFLWYGHSTQSVIRVCSIVNNFVRSKLTEHTASVNCLVSSERNQCVYSGSKDYTIKIWHHSSKDLITTLSSHKAVVVQLALSGDHRKLFSGSSDKEVKMWDLDTFTLVHTLSVSSVPNGIWWTSSGAVFIVMENNQFVKWNLSTNTVTGGSFLNQYINNYKCIYVCASLLCASNSLLYFSCYNDSAVWLCQMDDN